MNIAAMISQLGEHVDIGNLAAKIGLPPEQVEQAVAALAQAHTAPTDTLSTAAANTGLGADQLAQIVDHIGGEGSLGRFAQMLGNPGEGGGGLLDQIGSIASGFLGGKN